MVTGNLLPFFRLFLHIRHHEMCWINQWLVYLVSVVSLVPLVSVVSLVSVVPLVPFESMKCSSGFCFVSCYCYVADNVSLAKLRVRLMFLAAHWLPVIMHNHNYLVLPLSIMMVLTNMCNIICYTSALNCPPGRLYGSCCCSCCCCCCCCCWGVVSTFRGKNGS